MTTEVSLGIKIPDRPGIQESPKAMWRRHGPCASPTFPTRDPDAMKTLANLQGKVALVTGAARGIGRACALALAEAGADVVLGLRDPDAAGDVAAGVIALGRRALPVAMDVTRLDLMILSGAGRPAAVLSLGSDPVRAYTPETPRCMNSAKAMPSLTC